MVNIRLSVMSHGGSRLSWKKKKKPQREVTLTFGRWHNHHFAPFCFKYMVWCLKWVNTHCRSIPSVKTYLSASPQEAEQVSVLQLFHNCNQRSSKWDHTKKLWQERMRSQLGQEGCKTQEAVSFCGISRVCKGQEWERDGGTLQLQKPCPEYQMRMTCKWDN